jgi:hypothetical protein
MSRRSTVVLVAPEEADPLEASKHMLEPHLVTWGSGPCRCGHGTMEVPHSADLGLFDSAVVGGVFTGSMTGWQGPLDLATSLGVDADALIDSDEFYEERCRQSVVKAKDLPKGFGCYWIVTPDGSWIEYPPVYGSDWAKNRESFASDMATTTRARDEAWLFYCQKVFCSYPEHWAVGWDLHYYL